MYILLFIFLFIAMLAFATFDKLLFLLFQFDTENNDMHLTISWLYPLFMAKVSMSDYNPQLHVYLFNLRIFTKNIRKKPQKNKNFIRYLELKDSYANLYYGLNNPFNTAIASSIIGMIKAFVGNISVNQYPDFIPEQEYIVVRVGSKLNIGKSLIRFVRIRYFKNIIKGSNEYGSVQYD